MIQGVKVKMKAVSLFSGGLDSQTGCLVGQTTRDHCNRVISLPIFCGENKLLLMLPKHWGSN
jgi:hypothetical protein